MAIFTLKQVTEYYLLLESPVYICFMDASKAFDRINLTILFNKLAIRGINVLLISFLQFFGININYLLLNGMV